MNPIPIIDFKKLTPSDFLRQNDIIDEVHAACKTVGFLIIKNPPISNKIIEQAYIEARSFFNLPYDKKMQYFIGLQPNHRGYVPIGEEQYGNVLEPLDETQQYHEVKEGYEVGYPTSIEDPDFVSGAYFLGPNVWPEELPKFKRAIEIYFESLFTFGSYLFNLFAIALDIDPNVFHKMTKKPTSNLRLLKYHPDLRKQRKPSYGIGSHTDSECFTILSADSPGLQVYCRSGEWVDVPIIDNTFILNIGDTMEIITNGIYVSTQHRVISDGCERFSIPFFFGVNHFERIEPLTQFIPRGQKPNYSSFIAGPHKLSEYAKGFKYLQNLANAGKITLDTPPNKKSIFSKTNS